MFKAAAVVFLLIMPVALNAQTLPYEAPFVRLIGEPQDLVSALVTYPWKESNAGPRNGLNEGPHGNTIRIVSVELPISDYRRWVHWSSQDGAAWADIVDLSSRRAATELLQSAYQRHSGNRRQDEFLIFTNLCDSAKDSIDRGCTDRPFWSPAQRRF